MRRTAPALVIVLTLAFAGCGSTPAAARHPAQAVAVHDTRFAERRALCAYLAQLFDTAYAPLEYKHETLGWTTETALAPLVRAADDATVTDAQFRRLMYEVTRSPRDIHTGMMADDNPAVWLGLHIMRTDSGYRVAWIDRSVLPAASFDVQVGDEVVRFGGASIDEAVQDARARTMWFSTPRFEQSFAEQSLVSRGLIEWGQIPAPGDTVELVVRKDGMERTVRIAWRNMDTEPGGSISARCPFWGHSRDGYVPTLGEVVWRDASATVVPSYVFEVGGRHFGYLRLPTLGWMGDEARAALRELDAALDAFHTKNVRAVVVDLTGNGGGNYGLGLAMLSRLSTTPLRGPDQRFMLAADRTALGFPHPELWRSIAARLRAAHGAHYVADALAQNQVLLDALWFVPETPEAANDLAGFFEFVSTAAPGTARLSDAHYEMLSEFDPSPGRGARSTVPILLLLDERVISAPEFASAALQDSWHVVSLGTTTAGAGGDQRWFRREHVCGSAIDDPTAPCVRQDVARAMTVLGIKGIAMTAMLGVRRTTPLQFIENVGITPTHERAITAADLTGDFAPMKADIQQLLATLAR